MEEIKKIKVDKFSGYGVAENEKQSKYIKMKQELCAMYENGDIKIDTYERLKEMYENDVKAHKMMCGKEV